MESAAQVLERLAAQRREAASATLKPAPSRMQIKGGPGRARLARMEGDRKWDGDDENSSHR